MGELLRRGFESLLLRFVVSSLIVIGVAAGCGEGGADASQLEGTPWVLVSGTGITLPASVAPSALFSEGKVSGSTGCNQYSSSYTLDGDSLEIGEIAATLKACPPPADEIERTYVAALGEVAGWATDGEDLVLSDGGGSELLRFRAASTGR